LRSVLFRSQLLVPGLALLFGGFAVTFGSVVCATAIMLLPDRDDDDDQGGLGADEIDVPALKLQAARAFSGVSHA
jgi:hypothetical protein